MPIFGPRTGHKALFEEVCRFVALDTKTKKLLQSVIDKYQMPQPVKIFIEPETLMRALSDPDFEEENSDLQKLYDAWFIEKSPAGKKK